MLERKIIKKGPGVPIVFLHGFLGRSEDWLPLSSFLPPCQCIGFDLPGHGNSPFQKTFEIDLPQFHLVGYSLGGRLSLRFAKRALSLTLISTHPGLRREAEKKARLESDRKWVKLLFELPIDEFLTRWYDQSIFKPFKPDFSMRREQNLSGLAAALLTFSLAKQKHQTIDGVIVGERDLKFRALYKKPIVIPNAGHMVHLENPKAVAEIIQKRVGL